MTTIEKWKPVADYEGLYEVSDHGRLRRISTYGKRPKAICRIIAPHRKKVTRTGQYGYCDYWLYKNGEKWCIQAHVLVWTTFMGPIPKGYEINHKDGIKDRNVLDNLEPITRSENIIHRFRVLGHPPPNNPSPGMRNGSAKLTDEEVREIRRRYDAGGVFQHQLAKEFGVSQRTICLIVRREGWTHVA